jgi:hypothetical protein
VRQLLGLSEKQKQLILSVNKDNNPRRKYKEVFIALGERAKVYATEVSLEEYAAYTTEEKEKVEVQRRTAANGVTFRWLSLILPTPGASRISVIIRHVSRMSILALSIDMILLQQPGAGTYVDYDFYRAFESMETAVSTAFTEVLAVWGIWGL